jgi:hypothetical protein
VIDTLGRSKAGLPVKTRRGTIAPLHASFVNLEVLLKSFIVSFLAAFTLMIAMPPAADAIKIDPGMWEFKSVSKMPMMQQQQSHESTECVTEGERTPDEFLDGMEDCTISDVKSDDKIMAWTITCKNQSADMNGSAEMKSTGTTLNGKMNMSMSIPGHPPVTMEMNWEGKRLGPCDE